MPNPASSNPVRVVAVETDDPLHTIVDSGVIVIDDTTPVDVAVTNAVDVDDSTPIDVNVASGSIDTTPPSYQYDASGRLRVGFLNTLGDYKPTNSELDLFYDTLEVAGGASSWDADDGYFTFNDFNDIFCSAHKQINFLNA